MFEFIATHIFGILGTIAGLGGVGIIALIVFGGIPALAIIGSVVNFFKSMVQFFSTPLGQIVGIIILCVVVFFVADIRRARIDAAACKAADIAMQLKAAQRDKDIAADTAKLAQQQADDLAKENDTLNAKVADYEKSLASRPGPGCPLTGDDVGRLRDLIGQP